MPSHIIKNFEKLADSPLREDALTILESGYKAINTGEVIRKEVTLSGQVLKIKGNTFDLEKYKRIFVIGIGKCAFDAATELESILGEKITGGVVIDVKDGKLKRLANYVGTHPFPSEQNTQATLEIKKLLEQAEEDDLILTIISGGGSALMCLPYQIGCEELVEVTRELQKSGASIHETNIIRKHLSEIKGGQFAKTAYPATIAAIIFSDVPGNDLSVIASGPTVPDPTTKEEAEKVIKKYGIKNIDELKETPKGKQYFEKVHNILIVTNETMLEAMAKKAEEKGYKTSIYSTEVEGEAREIGKMFAKMRYEAKQCLLAGGETTVTIKGQGKGGRNQETALGALGYMEDEIVFIAATSDGWDNTDVAGAVADSALYSKSQKEGRSPEEYLQENNSYEFFKSLEGQIITGRTGANVADVFMILTGENYGK